MGIRRCEQIKCAFYLQGGCQDCNNCKAKPYEINTSCDMCLQCEGEEGELRFGYKNKSKTTGQQKILDKEQLKCIEVN